MKTTIGQALVLRVPTFASRPFKTKFVLDYVCLVEASKPWRLLQITKQNDEEKAHSFVRNEK